MQERRQSVCRVGIPAGALDDKCRSLLLAHSIEKAVKRAQVPLFQRSFGAVIDDDGAADGRFDLFNDVRPWHAIVLARIIWAWRLLRQLWLARFERASLLV
jgi:hypothetical protein